jgi:hypothetical protein
MDEDIDPLRKLRLQMDALNNPMREFQKQQRLLDAPFREFRERQQLLGLATSTLAGGAHLDRIRAQSLTDQHAEAMRPLLARLSAAGLASRASDSIGVLALSSQHQRDIQEQMKEVFGPTTIASSVVGAFARGMSGGPADAIRANLGSISTAIANLQNPFSVEAIAKRMSIDPAMIEAAHAYLSEEEQQEAEDSGVVSAAKKVVATLNANTAKRFDEMSWIDVVAALYFLVTLLMQHHDNLEQQLHHKVAEQTLQQSNDNADEIENLQRLATESAETIDAIAVRAAEYERIAELPRAVVLSRANVRVEARGTAERITVLEQGQQCAVEEVTGRCASCTYFDELTQQPRTGWIWKASLEFMN